jgi:hypothetical protein
MSIILLFVHSPTHELYVPCNNETYLSNLCCYDITKGNTTHSECVFVTLVIQHYTCMACVVLFCIYGLLGSAIFFHITSEKFTILDGKIFWT